MCVRVCARESLGEREGGDSKDNKKIKKHENLKKTKEEMGAEPCSSGAPRLVWWPPHPERGSWCP